MNLWERVIYTKGSAFPPCVGFPEGRGRDNERVSTLSVLQATESGELTYFPFSLGSFFDRVWASLSGRPVVEVERTLERWLPGPGSATEN